MMAHNSPVARYGPDIELLGQALSCLAKYGISGTTADGNSDVWDLILQQASRHSIRAYALGAAHAFDAFCIVASEYTLAVSLDTLTEGDALTMGAIYLRRLIFLHQGRRVALQRVIMEPPEQHAPTPVCSLMDQAGITRAWALGVAEILALPMLQNMPADVLFGTLGLVVGGTECDTCKGIIRSRTVAAGKAWLSIKQTI